MSSWSYVVHRNHFGLEPDLPAILGAHGPVTPALSRSLHDFGILAGGDAYEVAHHVDHDARPILVSHDLDGQRIDRVRLSPAHRDLLRAIAAINRPPYEAGGTWRAHYALGFLLADPGLYCQTTITQATIYAIYKYLPKASHWMTSLLDGNAFGATWMTESQGGSDLGANTTCATKGPQGFSLTGEKYFASGAGLADVALVTSRRPQGPSGAKGLALYLVPRLNAAGALNFLVRRLKDKSATRAIPSGEVSLVESEAEIVGEPELGIYYILENLLVSRLANAVAALGIARKAHLEAAFRVRTRHAFGRALIDQPLVRRDLTDMSVRIAGGLALSFGAIACFEKSWHERPPYSPAYHDTRIAAHLAKNRTASHAAHVTALAMEIFGGIGFLDEYAVARWHREALITPIWEGTSNIQALELLEALGNARGESAFFDDARDTLSSVAAPEADAARRALDRGLDTWLALPPPEAAWGAKYALDAIADALQVALLYRVAETGGERYAKLAALYARHFILHEEYPAWALDDHEVWDLAHLCPAGFSQ